MNFLHKMPRVRPLVRLKVISILQTFVCCSAVLAFDVGRGDNSHRLIKTNYFIDDKVEIMLETILMSRDVVH